MLKLFPVTQQYIPDRQNDFITFKIVFMGYSRSVSQNYITNMPHELSLKNLHKAEVKRKTVLEKKQCYLKKKFP
jgi:hypothetical protein